VTEARAWHGGNFYEIGIQIPDANFGKMNGVPHLKCRVAPLTFRDYTLSKWDNERKTGALFIDAAHHGPGSEWARSLRTADALHYLNIETNRYPVAEYKSLLFLGDQSAVGHFLALQQLADKTSAVSGAIVISHNAHREALKANYPQLPLQSVQLKGNLSVTLINWLEQQKSASDSLICLAGNTEMVIAMRYYLRGKGIPGKNIKAQGFW
jgi:NADPH-dependent ferric siderophore reductase